MATRYKLNGSELPAPLHSPNIYELAARRAKAQFGNSLLSAVSQRQHALNQWSKAGVERVAKQARQAERKVKEDNQILVKVPRKEQPTGLSVRNYDKNDAIRVAVEDALRATQNRGSSNRLGITHKGHIVTGVPDEQVEAMRTLIKADPNKDGAITGKELSSYFGSHNNHGYTGGNRTIGERLKDGMGQVEHTLGAFNYNINPLSGDTIVTDTYDFNKADYSLDKAYNDFKKQLHTPNSSLGQSLYPWLRYVAGKVNTHDDEPDNWKRHYRINITRQSGYSKNK